MAYYERIGLYRDAGLSCFENARRPEAESVRTAFIKSFKNEFSLNIVHETNLKVLTLDLTLGLSIGKYGTYNKLDNKPSYINVNSNHPSDIIKSPKNEKVSYSSMQKFESQIDSHNKKILNENIATPTSASCNCRVKALCPLDGNCFQSSLECISKAATPKITNNYLHYIDLTKNTFKDKLYKHKNSFRYKSKKTQLNYLILYGTTNMQMQNYL